jgi:transketolase
MVKLAAEHLVEKKMMRDAYSESLISLAQNDDRIVCVEADVSFSVGTVSFAQQFPERSINCGIMEANSVGVAAGLSAVGYVPFFHTFAVFASRRVYDQAFISCAYAGLNVKIVGVDAGITTAHNGGTHMPFEDVGIMRNIPHAIVIEPSDTTMFRNIMPQIANHYGLVYLRTSRKNSIKIYDDSQTFEIGKGVLLQDGTDVTLIAYGILVAEALKAAEELGKEGISARVIDMFTIKPIDADLIIDSALKTGAIVTAENHSIINGLGSAVSEVLTANIPVPLERIGSQDQFGEVGSIESLMQHFGMTATHIAAAARKVIARKK